MIENFKELFKDEKLHDCTYLLRDTYDTFLRYHTESHFSECIGYITCMFSLSLLTEDEFTLLHKELMDFYY